MTMGDDIIDQLWALAKKLGGATGASKLRYFARTAVRWEAVNQNAALIEALKDMATIQYKLIEANAELAAYRLGIHPDAKDGEWSWVNSCFGPMISADITKHNDRLFEDALELVEARGCTAKEAHLLMKYACGRMAHKVGPATTEEEP